MELSDNILVALISAIPPTIASVAALIIGLRNGRRVEEVRNSVNGLLEKNVQVNRSDAGQMATAIERERGVAVAEASKASAAAVVAAAAAAAHDLDKTKGT